MYKKKVTHESINQKTVITTKVGYDQNRPKWSYTERYREGSRHLKGAQKHARESELGNPRSLYGESSMIHRATQLEMVFSVWTGRWGRYIVKPRYICGFSKNASSNNIYLFLNSTGPIITTSPRPRPRLLQLLSSLPQPIHRYNTPLPFSPITPNLLNQSPTIIELVQHPHSVIQFYR